MDLQILSEREREQVEWKENVADEEDVVKTLVAFANDRANLGGGYVVCGAGERTDENGFPRVEYIGLTAGDWKRVEGKVLTMCRDRVSPPITPTVESLPAADPSRKILIFVMPQTGHAHQFRQRNGETNYWVRVSSHLDRAQNGRLLELLTLRGAVEPWDRRPCVRASIEDLDLLVLRDTLARLGRSDLAVQAVVSDEPVLHALVPALCVREPLTGVLRPRNFAILLFGREPQRFVQGSYSVLSTYPGVDRSEPQAERHELVGTLIEQAKRLFDLLDVESYTAYDKLDPSRPNALKYPKRALHEAAINALAHRSYEDPTPVRVTLFSDRIEIVSPGSLPPGVDPVVWQAGRSGARWRNQALAWFLERLHLAQGEGQGIPTIIRTMREEGCPAPRFEPTDATVQCVLPAHPRHTMTRAHRTVEEAIALGQLERARTLLVPLMEEDPANRRSVLLFAEVQRALRDPVPVVAWWRRHHDVLAALSSDVLLALADALPYERDPEVRPIVHEILARASMEAHDIRDVRRIALELKRFEGPGRAEEYLRDRIRRYPEWGTQASVLQLLGDVLLGQAKQCAATARRADKQEARTRAWAQSLRFLDEAELLLRRAERQDSEAWLRDVIDQNLRFLDRLRADARKFLDRSSSRLPDPGRRR